MIVDSISLVEEGESSLIASLHANGLRVLVRKLSRDLRNFGASCLTQELPNREMHNAVLAKKDVHVHQDFLSSPKTHPYDLLISEKEVQNRVGDVCETLSKPTPTETRKL